MRFALTAHVALTGSCYDAAVHLRCWQQPQANAGVVKVAVDPKAPSDHRIRKQQEEAREPVRVPVARDREDQQHRHEDRRRLNARRGTCIAVRHVATQQCREGRRLLRVRRVRRTPA